MKKVVRMLGLCALVALAFTSCKKNETNSTVTFKATMPQTVSDSRTYMDDYGFVLWSGNEQLAVYNLAGERDKATYKSGKDSGVANFVGDGTFFANITSPNEYVAYYPVVSPDEVKMVLPDEQQFVAYSFDNNLYPMYALNDANKNFEFHSDAGILTIRVKMDTDSQNTYTINHILLEATDTNDQLVGTMTYEWDSPFTGTPSYTKTLTSSTVDLLGCNTEPLSKDARDFNFVLFEGALANGFTVTLYLSNGQELSYTTSNNLPIAAQQRTLMQTIILN